MPDYLNDEQLLALAQLKKANEQAEATGLFGLLALNINPYKIVEFRKIVDLWYEDYKEVMPKGFNNVRNAFVAGYVAGHPDLDEGFQPEWHWRQSEFYKEE